MTRKHFEALAAALAKVRPPNEVSTKTEAVCFGEWLLCRDTIADTCQASNPRFDRAKFIKACEGES